MEHITLKKLRDLVDKTTGKKLPTARELKAGNDEVVAQAKIEPDGVLTVYRNGFFLYSVGGSTTVYAVDRCAEPFGDEPWTLSLMLSGEDRLELNHNSRHERQCVSILDEIRDPSDFMLEIEEQEAIDQMLSALTDRQREAVVMYYIEGLTQKEIQRRLGISRGTLLERLGGAKKKLRKFLRTPSKSHF